VALLSFFIYVSFFFFFQQASAWPSRTVQE
jgi:hypothetical protein